MKKTWRHHGGHQQRRHPAHPGALLICATAHLTEEESMKILVGGGHGLGTSLMMEMSIKSILKAGRDGRGGSPGSRLRRQ